MKEVLYFLNTLYTFRFDTLSLPLVLIDVLVERIVKSSLIAIVNSYMDVVAIKPVSTAHLEGVRSC